MTDENHDRLRSSADNAGAVSSMAGLKVLALHEDGIDLAATWREEWVVNPDRRYTHGGILAALIDLAPIGARQAHRSRRTHHRHAGRLSRCRDAGRSHREGPRGQGRQQFSTAEAHVYDAQGKLFGKRRERISPRRPKLRSRSRFSPDQIAEIPNPAMRI